MFTLNSNLYFLYNADGNPVSIPFPGLEDEGSLVVDVDDSGTRDEGLQGNVPSRAKHCQVWSPHGVSENPWLSILKGLKHFEDDVGKPHFRKPP